MARILVAEDDAHMLRLMSMLLSRHEHEVVEARDGDEARVALESSDVDCLVTDINMPGTDGVTLVRWLRDELGKSMPVIMLSARCDQEKIDLSLKGYRVSFHPKPFSPSRLIAEINKLISDYAAATTGR